MPRPTIDPRWADDPGRRLEPSSSYKGNGFSEATKSPAKFINFVLGNLADWAAYFAERIDAGYALKGQPIIYTSGSGTYTPTADIRAVRVLLIGGGGGGGGAQGGANPQIAASGGGASGSAVEVFVPRSVVAGAYAFDYSVGTGGTGGAGSSGANGASGTDSQVALDDSAELTALARGGRFGIGMTSGTATRIANLFATSPTAPSVSGSISSVVNGALLYLSNVSGLALATDGVTIASGGGPSPIFGGSTESGTAAADGSAPGAGGSGARATTTDQSGGNGAAGRVIIWEFV